MPPVVPAAGARPRRPRLIFFDLDDTLHDASHAIFGVLNRRMTDYVERHLEITRPEADRLRQDYWRRYGATLLGLIRHHGVDPAHFLRETHNFDVAMLMRAERGLDRLMRHIPGHKRLLTNAPDAYAQAVLRELALHRHLPRHSIESMRINGHLRPKPSRLMLRALLARERCAASDAVLVEDSRANLKAARALGMWTVLVSPARRRRGGGGRAPYVGLRVASVRDLPRALARLRR